MKLKISVVTVVYNASETIEKTLDSIKEQDYDNFESIIIDGGSQDGTIDIILNHELSPAYFVSESDRGISDAFNKGIDASEGDFIIFLSADDYFYNSQILTLVVNKLMSSKADVFSGAVIKNSHGQNTLVSQPKNNDQITRDMIFNHPSMFVRKSALVNVGKFSEKYKLAMDYDLVLKLYLGKYSFFNSEEIITVVSEEGISHQNYIDSRIEVLDIQKENGMLILPYFYFIHSVVRTSIRSLLEFIGLTKIVDIYRSNISSNMKRKL